MNIKDYVSGLEAMLFDLHPKAKGIYEAISVMKNIDTDGLNRINDSNAVNIPSGKGYDPKMNMKSKTLYAIRELNRFVKNREIAEFLNRLEPSISVKDFMSSLSNPLFVLKNENRVHKISIGTGNNGVYWGSAKWLNESGTIKLEHMYVEGEKPEEIEI